MAKPRTCTPKPNERKLDANQTAALHVSAVTGRPIPSAAELTDDPELLAAYEAAKAREKARRR